MGDIANPTFRRRSTSARNSHSFAFLNGFFVHVGARGGDRSIISQSIFGKERGIGDTFARLESVSRGPYYSMGQEKERLARTALLIYRQVANHKHNIHSRCLLVRWPSIQQRQTPPYILARTIMINQHKERSSSIPPPTIIRAACNWDKPNPIYLSRIRNHLLL